eukprot:9494832-Pyramimonas_sp.AAC.1
MAGVPQAHACGCRGPGVPLAAVFASSSLYCDSGLWASFLRRVAGTKRAASQWPTSASSL